MALDSDLEGFVPNPGLQRPIRHAPPVIRQGPTLPPVIKAPEPASSMTYQQYVMLPESSQRIIWEQLTPWQREQFEAEQARSQPA